MNQNARKWVKALRSGKYKRARAQLARGEGKKRRYCCLGVACDLYQREHPDFEYHDTNGTLPEVVQAWLGLETDHGAYTKGTKGTKLGNLAGLNDAQKNFDYIAGVIESEPSGLFARGAGHDS